MTNTPSFTRELLALPEIGSAGLQNSIVYTALPADVQAAIREADDEERKTDIAVEAGDKLPIIAQMHEHFIAAPARRRAQGQAFPTLVSLDDFPLPGVLKDRDRAWLRPGKRIPLIEGNGASGRWFLTIVYEDGERRHTDAVTTLNELYAELDRIEQALKILGLRDSSES